MYKKNVTFSRCVPRASSLPGNGCGSPPCTRAVEPDVDALVLPKV